MKRDSLELAGFNLIIGKYQPIEANEQGYLWSEQLELYLGIEQGVLRFFTPEGQLVAIPTEIATQETIKATQAELKATQAQEIAQRLAAKLKELNIDPDTL